MKKLLFKSTMFVPLVVLLWLLWEPRYIYIKEIHFSIQKTMILYIYMIGTVLWLNANQLRKSCCNGRVTEMFFNLLPTEVLALLFFAQWHFLPAISCLLCIFISMMFFYVFYKKHEKQHINIHRRTVARRNAYSRFLVFITFFVSLIPMTWLIIAEGFKGPDYSARGSQVNAITPAYIFRMDNEELYKINQRLFLCFDEEQWGTMSLYDKAEAIQLLADFEAQVLGIPPVTVEVANMEYGVLGCYDGNRNIIRVDTVVLNEETAECCMTTIIHEMYHAYQEYLVNNIDWNDAVSQTAYFKSVRMWKDNSEMYMNEEIYGYDAYWEQPLENSARQYAEEEVAKIMKYIQ